MPNETPLQQTLELSYGKAINAALFRALDEMPSTILFGEDVAKPGGVFGVTKDLQKTFGTSRVFDTPISETAMLGTAVGAAMCGVRPIVEIMWIDFTLVAMDQIVNQAANVRYVSAGKLQAPMTIRTQQGALPGSCAQHSQNLEAMYAHVPGLRVGIPATPQDAYDILLTSIVCEDPTLVIENRGLYHTLTDQVTINGPIQSRFDAHLTRQGDDITIVTWGSMLHRVHEAADVLKSQHGISAEVVNARWVAPFDWPTLVGSVKKTGRLLVVHEANLTGGFGAEIAATIHAECFAALKKPVMRLATPDIRMPAAPHLQNAIIPSKEKILHEALMLIG